MRCNENQATTSAPSSRLTRTPPKIALVSPHDILPIPHVDSRNNEIAKGIEKRKSRKGVTVVATSTPFIDDLKRKKDDKEQKEQEKKIRNKKSQKGYKTTIFLRY